MFAGFRVEQPVGVQDEIAHLRVVDRALGRALPGEQCSIITWESPDEVDLIEIGELERANALEFAANDEVKEALT